MKTGIPTLAAIAAAFFGLTAITSADPVVFNVNLAVQTAKGTFNAGNGDGVRVLGLNGDWSTGITMVPNATNADIYTVTNSLPAASWPNYKFVIAPTSSAWIWESPASFGGGNRYFQVPTGGTNLPVVYFSDDTNLPSYTVQITFLLDMQVATLQGHFTPGSDYVVAFGSFDNWGNSGDSGVLLTNIPGTTNYTGMLITTTLATNTQVIYKYAIDGHGGTWEGSVGTNGGNRSFTLISTNQVLPLDFWNNITNATVSFTVGFQVDMIAEDAFGNFTPGSDTVFVNGDWSSFSGSDFQLTEVGSSDLYTGAVAMALSPGATVNYKYTIDGGVIWENDNVGAGGARNHQFVLSNTNLALDYFNDYSNLGPITISGPVGQTALYWASGTNANNRIQLQSTTNLLSGWTDVPNTQGQSSITTDFGSGPVYFRLIGP